ncbi:hypothetical protein [Haloarchaeobius sp. DT45]|uniref:hypothetical protein n=1 Tax=Haloarchaeobius sp. DT45 TaxID=3446116 RepID=UPI003F6CDC29
MRRRTLLASVGTVLATAGCLSDAGSPGADGQRPDPETDTTATETPVPTSQSPAAFSSAVTVGGTTFRFTGVTTRHSYFHLTFPDAMAVEAADGQFLFVGVAVESGQAPELGAFDLVVGDETYALSTELGERNPYSVPVAAGNGGPYDPEEGAGWLGADVPAPSPGPEPLLRLSVGGDTRDVALPGFLADELGDPAPEYTFDDISAPDSVGPGEDIVVELPVTNEGDGTGTARAVVNEEGPMYAPHRMEASLDPGQSTTLTEHLTSHLDYGVKTDTVRFEVRAPGVESSHEVTIEDSA